MESYCRVVQARKALEKARAQQVGQNQPGSSGKGKDRYRNITDPDSRSMPTRKGWIVGYNAQLAVSSDQIILAVQGVQNPADNLAFIPMLAKVEKAAEVMRAGGASATIGTVLADAGYRSTENITCPGPDRLIATGRGYKDARRAREEPASGPVPTHATAREAMDHKIRTPQGRELYRHRAPTVEGVNGQLKDVIGLRRFSRRGLPAINSELSFAAAVHNLLKVFRARPATA